MISATCPTCKMVWAGKNRVYCEKCKKYIVMEKLTYRKIDAPNYQDKDQEVNMNKPTKVKKNVIDLKKVKNIWKRPVEVQKKINNRRQQEEK